jgi:hypothetical protein
LLLGCENESVCGVVRTFWIGSSAWIQSSTGRIYGKQVT